jgi:hypothetical protein
LPHILCLLYPNGHLKHQFFSLSFTVLVTKQTCHHTNFQARFKELLAIFDGYIHIYTDGSKDGAAIAAAAICRGQTLTKRLPDHASIFSAELRRYYLHWTSLIELLQTNFLFSQSIQNRNLENPIILQIVNHLHNHILSGLELSFMWLPSHTGVAGNSAADQTSWYLIQTSKRSLIPTSCHAGNIAGMQNSITNYVRSYLRLDWRFLTPYHFEMSLSFIDYALDTHT